MAPAYAMSEMLARANLSLQDFDYYEIHEARRPSALAPSRPWKTPTTVARNSVAAGDGADRPVEAERERRLAGCRPPAFAATGGRSSDRWPGNCMKTAPAVA